MKITKQQLLTVIKEELEQLIDEKKKKGSSGKKDACYYKVKARYDVWPSAYASGALVKCRKVGAKNWGKSTTKEELELYEGKEGLEAKIRKVLIDEGGAAGMDALEKGTGAEQKEIKDAIKGMSDVGLHKNGDYILQDGEEIDVKKKISEKEDRRGATPAYCKRTPCDEMGFTQKASCKSQGIKDCYRGKKKNEAIRSKAKRYDPRNYVGRDAGRRFSAGSGGELPPTGLRGEGQK